MNARDNRSVTRTGPAPRGAPLRGSVDFVPNKPRLQSYLVEADAATAEDVEASLWNAGITPADYAGESASYQAAVLDQYKLYIEMADRVSARRALANSFFLSLNTVVFTAIGFFWEDRPETARWSLLLPLVALLGQCLAWFWIVRSYRQVNSVKWAVVGALEKRLPASPWWGAEWGALGNGNDPSRYWQLTRVEQLVPLLFAVAYLTGFVAVIAS